MPNLKKIVAETGKASFIKRLPRATVKTHNRVFNPLLLRHLTDAYDLGLKTDSIGRAIVAFAEKAFLRAPGTSLALALLRTINKWVPAIYGDEGAKSQQKIISDVRKIIDIHYQHNEDILKQAYKALQFDSKLRQAENIAYAEKVMERNLNKQVFKLTDIYDVIDGCVISDDPYRHALAIELSTGARIGEILSLSKFNPVEGSPNWVMQTGLSKTKEDRIIVKPILFLSYDQIQELVDSVRKGLKDKIDKYTSGDTLDYYALSKDLNNNVNYRAKKLFAPRKVTSHTLRAIYANAAYTVFGNNIEVSEAAFIAGVLGHKANSLTTAASYSTIGIINDDNELE
jgi:integrase